MVDTKCTFGTRPEVDLQMLNEKIYREVKHFRNYKTYRPNFGSLPVATKFYAAHDQLKDESEEQTKKVADYAYNVAQTRAKGPHSKYPAPVTESHVSKFVWSPIFNNVVTLLHHTNYMQRQSYPNYGDLYSENKLFKFTRKQYYYVLYGWYLTPLVPVDRNDRRFYHPKVESENTKIEVIISMSNPKKRAQA